MHRSKFSWCDWLYAPRNDGKPRTLRLNGASPNKDHFVEQIKKVYLNYTIKNIFSIKTNILQDFSKASRPVSFFVYVRALVERAYVQEQDTCLDNGQTNERLTVKTTLPPPHIRYRRFYPIHVLISRYPVGANQEWIAANEKETLDWKLCKQNRQIHFEQSLDGGNVSIYGIYS
jgi:hypothetical protein